HAFKKYRVGFKGSFLILTTLFFSTSIILWYQSRPSYTPTRVAIFPFINDSYKSQKVTWDGLAIAEMVQSLLAAEQDKVLAYPVDWILAAANLDSLRFSDYRTSFSRKIKADFALWGTFEQIDKTYIIKVTFYDFASGNFKQKSETVQDVYHLIEFAGRVSERILADLCREEHTFVNTVEFCCDEQVELHFKAKVAQLYNEKEEAFRLAEAAVAVDSSATVCLNFLAELILQQAEGIDKRGGDAFPHFKKAKELLLRVNAENPQNYTSLRFLGQLYLANEKWNEAQSSLLESHTLNPHQAELLYSVTRLNAKRYSIFGFESEEDLLQQAIYMNPAFFAAYLSLADYYHLKNRNDRALKAVRDVLNINPSNVDGLMALAKIYLAKKDWVNCLETYEKVMELDSENADVFYNIGIVYYYDNDFTNAIKYFEHAVALKDHLDSRLYLAYIYEKLGDTTKAISYLRERIQKRQSEDDRFAEEARKHLFQIMTERGVIDSLSNSH
ncbi:MAG: tetratricopeptide repeat protein, partial [bacterium]